jgi:hypothetical protein
MASSAGNGYGSRLLVKYVQSKSKWYKILKIKVVNNVNSLLI